MKVDIIITIRDSQDHDSSIQSTFEECDSEAMLANPELKFFHESIRRFTAFFDDEESVGFDVDETEQ